MEDAKISIADSMWKWHICQDPPSWFPLPWKKATCVLMIHFEFLCDGGWEDPDFGYHEQMEHLYRWSILIPVAMEKGNLFTDILSCFLLPWSKGTFVNIFPLDFGYHGRRISVPSFYRIQGPSVQRFSLDFGYHGAREQLYRGSPSNLVNMENGNNCTDVLLFHEIDGMGN